MDFVLFAFNFTNQKPKDDVDKIIDVVKSYENLLLNDLCYIIKSDVNTIEFVKK